MCAGFNHTKICPSRSLQFVYLQKHKICPETTHINKTNRKTNHCVNFVILHLPMLISIMWTTFQIFSCLLICSRAINTKFVQQGNRLKWGIRKMYSFPNIWLDKTMKRRLEDIMILSWCICMICIISSYKKIRTTNYTYIYMYITQ